MTDGRTVCRDASQFKVVNSVINTKDETGGKADEGNLSMVQTESRMQTGGMQSARAPTELVDDSSTDSVGNAEAKMEPGKDTDKATTATDKSKLGENQGAS